MKFAHALGNTSIYTVSMDENVSKAMQHLFDSWIGDEFPVQYDPNSHSINVSNHESLIGRLNNIPIQELANSVFIVDLTLQSLSSHHLSESQDGFRYIHLVLQYPEIYWIFVVNHTSATKIEGKFSKQIQDFHFVSIDNLINLRKNIKRHLQGFRCWFDPTVLRACFRGDKKSSSSVNCNDSEIALVLDEEKNYLMMNAYVLYRDGCNAYLGSSSQELDSLNLTFDSDCETDDSNKQEKFVFDRVLEDFELFYGDITGSKGEVFSPNLIDSGDVPDLSKRDERFPYLKSKKRILVSSKYLNTKELDNVKSLVKPYLGIYDKGLKSLNDNDCDSNFSDSIFNLSIDSGGSNNNHSANFTGQYIASRLINRVHSLDSSNEDFCEKIYSCIFAIDALRLLQGKTRTLWLESIELLFKNEVKAECLFAGISKPIPIKDRLNGLQKILTSLGETSNGLTVNTKDRASYFKEKMQLNSAILQIEAQLRRIYADHGFFEEEESVLIDIRAKEVDLRKLGALTKKTNLFSHCLITLWSNFISLFGKYLNFNMESILHILGSTVFWIFIFSVTYRLIDPQCTSYWSYLNDSIRSFISLAPPDWAKGTSSLMYLNIIVNFELLFGIVHIGMFISLLYQKTSRR